MGDLTATAKLSLLPTACDQFNLVRQGGLLNNAFSSLLCAIFSAPSVVTYTQVRE